MRSTRTALLLALLCASPRALAQSPAPPTQAQVDRWMDEGIQLRGALRDEEALERFRLAWEATRAPEPRAQMALAEQALGRWSDAERGLLAALAHPEDPWISRNRVHLDAALAETRLHLASVLVRCDAPGAVLSLNGREVGPLPLASALRVEAGSVLLEVRAPGRVAARRQLEVRAGDNLLETLVAPLVSTFLTSGPEGSARGAQAPPPAPRAVPLGLLAGGASLLAAGVAGLGWREASAVSFNAQRAQLCAVNTATGAVLGAPECAGLRTQSTAAVGLSVAGFVGGAALGVAGLVLLLRSPSPPARATLACAPEGPGLRCAGTF